MREASYRGKVDDVEVSDNCVVLVCLILDRGRGNRLRTDTSGLDIQSCVGGDSIA